MDELQPAILILTDSLAFLADMLFWHGDKPRDVGCFTYMLFFKAVEVENCFLIQAGGQAALLPVIYSHGGAGSVTGSEAIPIPVRRIIHGDLEAKVDARLTMRAHEGAPLPKGL